MTACSPVRYSTDLLFQDIDLLYRAHSLMNAKGNVSLVKSLQYPPIDENDPASEHRAGEHFDKTTITLLFQDQMGGLQVSIRPYSETRSGTKPTDRMRHWAVNCSLVRSEAVMPTWTNVAAAWDTIFLNCNHTVWEMKSIGIENLVNFR